MDRTFVSETVASRDAGTEPTGTYSRRVSETKVQSRHLERSPFLRRLCLGEFQRFKPGLVGQQCHPWLFQLAEQKARFLLCSIFQTLAAFEKYAVPPCTAV
jgi:hypothetical protein